MAIKQVYTLPINNLQPNPLQPRGKIMKEGLDELISSVKQYGILEPLVVAHTPAGYQIIAGERRWRAAQAAGLLEVPVIVRETTPRGMLEMAIVENVQRIDLSPLERAQAFQQLIRDFRFSISQIAEKVGKSTPYISNSIRLLGLPDAIKDGLAGGLITEGHARALAQVDDEKAMVECYKIILKESASVRRAEELSRKFKEISQQKPSTSSTRIIQSAYMEKVKSALEEVFSERTLIKLVRSHRQTKVTFVFKGTPEQTDAELEKIIALSEKSKED